MIEALKMKNDLYYIGVSDENIRIFDIIMKTANGTTYNAYLLKTTDLLSCMMLIEKKGKFGGSFGSYGWSGEAVDMMNSRLKSLKFRVPLEPMKIKLIPAKTELLDCYDFGFEFGEVVNGKIMEMTL